MISFYVPVSHLEAVKNALFEAGAGKYDNYDRCCWQILGQGQFRALDGAHPFIGNKFETEYVKEYKVEMICEDESIEQAIEALRKAHPYEVPGFNVFPINQFDKFNESDK